MELATISPHELARRRQQHPDLELIDVRTPVEFRELRLEFARNVPLDRLDPAHIMQSRNTNAPLYVICQKGGRGKTACQRFIDLGYANVINVEGGTHACDQAGLPVIRGRKTIALERQVRIAAGLLVLIGIALGFFVHPALFGLSAFVGARLVFAGLTDTCGMGMVLARMPWNQCKADE